MNIVGVTGTNGKTTCVHLICNLIKDHTNCASFGTLGIKQYINDYCFETKTTLTTLGNQELHKNLSEVAKNDCKFVAMEVSSHGLDQKRTANVNFSVAVFTNLSHDHLDYHKTMEHYFQTKVKLFTDYTQELKYAVINLDDPYGLKLIEILINNNHKLKIIGFSTKTAKEHIDVKNIDRITCEQITFNTSGIQATITTPWGTSTLNTPLLGIHNLSNLIASIAVCMCSFDNLLLTELLEKCSKLQPATGRLQHINGWNIEYPIIIDYAHTPDGLEKALKAIKQHYHNKKICCVFGCGGNRDATKRPKMLEVTDHYCDAVILTQDNSRFENPEQIIADILSYKTTKLLEAPIVEMDRKQAIYKAIKHYYKDYIILIAGKGHETKQIIGDQEYPFCDGEVAEEALNNV
ncbi:MAG: UDP-N-acetylmuramoyl-L-alanyl-D-glutamate--2,6-diaminopimelate ligase [Gammaproteobacteria bacterium]|jgi:UDP-N-acetylmuramoyl-L-alanyl-D-glutamate--2,6-diaminopimelate ligase